MLSVDLENLACALEQVQGDFSADNAEFLSLVCSNLHSLAHRVHMLEAIPVTPIITKSLDDNLPLQ